MAGDRAPSQDEVLGQIRFLLAQRIDFRRADTATSLAKVRLLTAAAIYFNTLSVGTFGCRVWEGR